MNLANGRRKFRCRLPGYWTACVGCRIALQSSACFILANSRWQKSFAAAAWCTGCKGAFLGSSLANSRYESVFKAPEPGIESKSGETGTVARYRGRDEAILAYPLPMPRPPEAGCPCSRVGVQGCGLVTCSISQFRSSPVSLVCWFLSTLILLPADRSRC